jgi:hypothetical protein
MQKHLSWLLLFCVWYRLCPAQPFDEKDFTRYTKLDGLSHNYITGIVQDSTGYLWVATNKGLNRFDGKSFTNFFKSSENSPIPENLVLSLQLQNQHEILGTTVAGAFSYHTLTRRHQYFIVPSDPVIFFWANQAFQVLQDKDKHYVVSTKTGLYVFDRAGKVICRYDHYRPEDAGKTELWFGNWLSRLSNGTVFQENNLSGSVYRPGAGQIDTFYALKNIKRKRFFTGKVGDERVSFAGPGDHIFLPHPEGGTMEVYHLLTGAHSSSRLPAALLSDLDWYSKLFYLNDSLLALTSKVGGFYLLRFSATEKKLSSDGRKYFASKYCTSLLRDYEGRLWIGTNDGLYKQQLRNRFFAVEDLSLQYPGIIHTGIQSVFIARDKILVGLRNEGGLLLLDKQTKRVERAIGFEQFGAGSNTINFMYAYHPDTLWIGTGKGILWFSLNRYTSGRLNLPGQPGWMYRTRTRNYLEDSEGNVWLSFGGLNSVLLFDRAHYRFQDLSGSPLLKITFCFSMAEDRKGNVWLAGDGLCRWNRSKKAFDTLIPYPSVSKSLFNYMQVLDCDENNNLWISGFDNEIIQYDCNRNRMHLRLPENSMIDGYSVTNSRLIGHHIWLGMVNGISAFNTKDYSIKQFSYADGLPSAVATSHRKGSFYDEEANRFYFGAGQYLISFVPDVHRSNKPLPRFAIEVFGVHQQLPEQISLPYSENSVELRLNTINFADPEENRFAYRLANESDSSWHDLHTKNVIILSKLSPGIHRIQVRLFSVNNRWPQQMKTIVIRVRPPFWRTAPFLALAAVGIMAVLYAFYRHRIRQIRQRANIDKQLAGLEIKALHAQMNPHFIFNCLNSIREMILNNENQQASRYLGKFAHLIRITLNQSTQPFVSLQNTVDYLRRYLEMEQIRTTHFTYTIEVDEDLQPQEIYLPPMLIQPFIENSIWHGTSPHKQTLQLTIRFFQKARQLLCIVEDDGVGIEASLEAKKALRPHDGALQPDHCSLGIANVQQRIRVLNEKYNLQSSITIEDKHHFQRLQETGTRVTLYLPLAAGPAAIKTSGI